MGLEGCTTRHRDDAIVDGGNSNSEDYVISEGYGDRARLLMPIGDIAINHLGES